MEDLKHRARFAHQVVESILVDIGDRDPSDVVVSDGNQLWCIGGTAIVLQEYVQVAAVARVRDDDIVLPVAIHVAHRESVEERPVARHNRIDVWRVGENAGSDLPQYAKGLGSRLEDDVISAVCVHIGDLDPSTTKDI